MSCRAVPCLLWWHVVLCWDTVKVGAVDMGLFDPCV